MFRRISAACNDLLRVGRNDDAAALAESAAASFPAEPVWPALAARAHSAAGRHSAALRSAQAAAALQPAGAAAVTADLWYALGLAALADRAWSQAARALDEAARAAPDNPGIAPHLAAALQSLQRPGEAAVWYRKALPAAPGDMLLRFNFLLCLLADGKTDEAESLLRSWPEPVPGTPRPERDLARAHLLEARGRHAEASALLENPEILSLAEKGGFADAAHIYILRGRLFYASARLAEARRAYRAALRVAPDSTDAANALGSLLLREGRVRDAEALWAGFIRRNGPAPLLEARKALSIPPVPASAAEIEEIRNRMSEFLRKAGNLPILGHPLAVLGVPPFSLAFHGKDDKTLLQALADFMLRHTAPVGRAEPAAADPAGKTDDVRRRAASLRPPQRRRIGFISAHFGPHTVMSYFFRLLEKLCPRLPHCRILEFPQEDNPYRRALAERTPLITLPGNLEGAKAAVAALDLDILVYLDLGMDPLTWVTAFSRLARLQCALYGHPMTTGIPALDIFLTPACMEPDGAAAFYSEELRTLPGLLSGFMPPCAPAAGPREKRRGRVYLCAQSLFKVHPDLDASAEAILREDAEAELRFFVSAREHETRAFRERLQRSLGAAAARVRMLPQCSEAAFIAALRDADLVLDTPHFSGGSTSYKALGAGVPVLTLEGAFMRGRQTAGLYRFSAAAAGSPGPCCFDGLIARSPAEYCAKALELAHSPARRREYGLALAAVGSRLFEHEDSVAALESFLLSTDIFSYAKPCCRRRRHERYLAPQA
ncbi:MAG: tetratricopeptide repeat protein [Desulfovibrio sp.]|jgi:predicted O-linked N-acetylglucosamine transferase (SPINDLY family)|nr:tetratricopeptide repeat protein [Desulfovibrio sp.]